MPHAFTVLLTNSSDIYGGGEFFVLELAKALLGRGHRIWVCCRPDNLLREKCEQAGVPIVPLAFPPNGRLVKHIRDLKRIILERGVNIVHTNGNYDRTAGAFAAWRAGVAHVTNVHSLQSIQHNLTHRVRNRMLTDRFLADGVRVKELLVQQDGIPPSGIVVFYHGVNPDSMRRDQQLRSSTRKQLGCPGDEVIIGNVARFVGMKGHSYLLNAFAEVAGEFSHARLVLVGDGELWEESKALSRTLGVEKRVIFTGFREDLQALYSSFDIYAHASIEGAGETISFAVQQALAQELPVIVTRVGDVAENVREGINGFVVPDRDGKALAARLRTLLGDRSLRETMGLESRKYLLERFTTERMVSAVESVYRDVLKTRV